MSQPDMTASATCTAHDPAVPLHVQDENDDSSRVTCPECQTDFGTWGEIKAKMLEAAKEKIGNDFKDAMKRAGWET